MLTISTDTLPQTCLSYIAFRVAFQETLERIALARQVGEEHSTCYGFLTEVPFLRGAAPHVQLDLLAETWCKHMDDEPFEATLVDESVVYAVCETAARMAEDDAGVVRRLLKGGPLDVDVPVDHFLASELRNLHLNLSNEGDFLLLSQFEDIPPDEARRLKEKFEIDEELAEEMFEVLGLWSMSADFLTNLNGLLTHQEVVRAVRTLGSE